MTSWALFAPSTQLHQAGAATTTDCQAAEIIEHVSVFVHCMSDNIWNRVSLRGQPVIHQRLIFMHDFRLTDKLPKRFTCQNVEASSLCIAMRSQKIAIYHLLRFISWNLITRCLAVTGGGSIGECYRLSRPRWLLVRCNVVILAYLLI